MSHILKNSTLEVHLDLPSEGYRFSRFDWTGKITGVKYRNIPMTTIERTDNVNAVLFGKALYNEFGIDTALGFEEAKPGEWFHKIGIGALKKTKGAYQFTNPYEIRPAKFHVEPQPNQLRIDCHSESINGYAYSLSKVIRLQESCLIIDYKLHNTGDQAIVTDEYVHNFIGVDKELIGKDYVLRFPFAINVEKFQALVNPEGKMDILKTEVSFKGNPNEQFFVSHLNGKYVVEATWELVHLKSGSGVRETGSFPTRKVNLWGWTHVVSPELFTEVHVAPGNSAKWSRRYEVFVI